MALVTVMLIMTLVTVLVFMALNVSQIEMSLSATNRRTIQGFHAAQGGLDISFPVLTDTLVTNAVQNYPSAPASPTVFINTPATTPASKNLFLQKITTGTWSSGVNDNVNTNPNLTITAIPGQNISVDIDYEGPVSPPGSGLDDFGGRYHKLTGGTGCSTGTLYYVDALANGPMKSQSETVGSYYSCY